MTAKGVKFDKQGEITTKGSSVFLSRTLLSDIKTTDEDKEHKFVQYLMRVGFYLPNFSSFNSQVNSEQSVVL